MRLYRFFIPLFTIISLAVSAKTFNQLIQEKKINYVAKFSSTEKNKIEIELNNLSNLQLTVEIPSGYIFESVDKEYQNYVVTQQCVLNLPAKQKIKEFIDAFCCNATLGRPQDNMLFKYSEINNENLIELCQLITKAKETLSEHVIQSQIWSISNNHLPLPIIENSDNESEKLIKAKTYEILKMTPVKYATLDEYMNRYDDYNQEFESTQNASVTNSPKYKVSIGIELNFITSDTALITSGIYEENGAEIYNFFRNKPLKPGKHQLKGEWKMTDIPEKKNYVVKTFKDGEELSSRTLKM